MIVRESTQAPTLFEERQGFPSRGTDLGTSRTRLRLSGARRPICPERGMLTLGLLGPLSLLACQPDTAWRAPRPAFSLIYTESVAAANRPGYYSPSYGSAQISFYPAAAVQGCDSPDDNRKSALCDGLAVAHSTATFSSDTIGAGPARLGFSTCRPLFIVPQTARVLRGHDCISTGLFLPRKKMVDVAVAAQLQQWTFDKPAHPTRPERSGSDSSASSPSLCDDMLRIDTSSPEQQSPAPRKESIVLQERYMSSEEDLSPADDGSESEYDYDHVVIHDAVKECKARTMSISRWDKGKSCDIDLAVRVSYAFAGRPKVVELQDNRCSTIEAPTIQQRSASLANLPNAAINQLRKTDAAQRLSMKPAATVSLRSTLSSRAPTPAIETDKEPRRPSTSHSPTTANTSALHLTNSTSTTSSFQTARSTSSISPAVDALLARPLTAVAPAPSSARSSVYVSSQTRSGLSRVQTTQPSNRQSQWAPPTPASPATHAFLSSDPYENSNSHSASPIIKPAPHRRLRSISMKLALAKIAITPSKKTYDSRVDGKMPNTPATPLTPQTAPLQGSSSFASPNKLRRASTILRPRSRHGETSRGPSPEAAPPVPNINVSTIPQHRMSKMQARGASEIEPTLVLPPCPSDTDDDAMSSFKSRKIKKRKSLMSLIDVL